MSNPRGDQIKSLAARFVEAETEVGEAERSMNTALNIRDGIVKELKNFVGPNIPERHVFVNDRLVRVDQNGVSLIEVTK